MTLAELQAYIGGDHFDHIHPLKFSAVLQGTPLLLKALENVSIALMEGFPPPLAGLSFTFFGQIYWHITFSQIRPGVDTFID